MAIVYEEKVFIPSNLWVSTNRQVLQMEGCLQGSTRWADNNSSHRMALLAAPNPFFPMSSDFSAAVFQGYHDVRAVDFQGYYRVGERKIGIGYVKMPHSSLILERSSHFS
jgi:hypothetical protein